MSPMHRMRTANSRPHHPRKFPFDFEETLRFRDMCVRLLSTANANGARALRAFVVARRSASPFGERLRRRATRVTRVSKADVWPGRRCAPSASVASVWSEPSRQSDVRDSVRPSVSQSVRQCPFRSGGTAVDRVSASCQCIVFRWRCSRIRIALAKQR